MKSPFEKRTGGEGHDGSDFFIGLLVRIPEDLKFMRFSLLSMTLIMVGMLVAAVFVTDAIRYSTAPAGHSLVLVLLRSSDTKILRHVLENSGAPTVRLLRERGVSFARCTTSSPWYPAAVASFFTGFHPSEHGLHRGHVHLTDEATTLAESLGSCGFRSFAAVERGSLLSPSNVLQGFSYVTLEEPGKTIPACIEFMESLPPYRNAFCVVEVDLDAAGGARRLEGLLSDLYAGLGGPDFLESGILAVLAPEQRWPDGPENPEGYDPGMPVVLAGNPLKIGPGKYVLKCLSLCDLGPLMMDLALGRGFNIRDALRTGRAVVTEMAADYHQVRDEVSKPPPHFHRWIAFDDTPDRYLVSPEGRAWIPADRGAEPHPDSAWAGKLADRYRDYLEHRRIIPDRAIPQAAGPVLDEGLARALGPSWQRPAFLGRHLHAVEHYRLGSAFYDMGYPALAVNELNTALIMDRNFPHALFLLAEVYASIDPEGARKHYRVFLSRYGFQREYQHMAATAQRFLKD